MAKYVLAICLLLAFTAADADVELWEGVAYKQDEPNELAYLVSFDTDCALSEEKVESIVEGVLIRSRIKPLTGTIIFESNVYLSVSVDCLILKSSNPVFAIDVRFGKFTPVWEWKEEPPVLYMRNFGSFGIGDKSFFESATKGAVEDAVTAYLEANLDLSGDDE